MHKVAVYLNRHLTGNVFDKDSLLEAYSTDQSSLRIKPRFVAIPETTSDIRKLVRFCFQLSEKKCNLPIAVRGSGLCKTGADLSSGIVISTERLNHVLELDAHDRLAHVQSGITLGKLNAVLATHGLTLPIHADPNETIGALIANALRDGYSNRYGGIIRYVDRLEVILSNGELIQTSRLTGSRLANKKKQNSFEGELYEKLDQLIANHANTIADLPAKSLAGYPGLKHVCRSHVFDLTPIFFGSEGSLGIISEVILRLEVLPPHPQRLFAVFNSLKSTEDFIESIEKLTPLTIELYDNAIFQAVDKFGKKPNLLTRKLDDGFTVLVAFNDKTKKSQRKAQQCLRFLPKTTFVGTETTKNPSDFDAFTCSLNAYLNNTDKPERPNFLHDFYIPREHLTNFLADLKTLEKIYKKPLELFGCYSTGIYSIRPEFDLAKIAERRTALTLLRDFNTLLKKYGGSLAGGLPEGRIKSIIIYPEMDKEEKKLYQEVKELFDKNNVFSSGVKTEYDIKDAVRHLRVEPLKGVNS